jgi:hypothetical protein
VIQPNPACGEVLMSSCNKTHFKTQYHVPPNRLVWFESAQLQKLIPNLFASCFYNKFQNLLNRCNPLQR